ncbi:MAG: ABC transporter permease [Holophagaceae bacterium]|nr:ABC transporter permease [Holophagaceae bacterium]
MLKRIICHETMLNLVSLRFQLIIGLFVVMFFGSLIVNIDCYNTKLKEYSEVVAVTDPYTMAIPPNPLGIFAEGTDKNSAMSVVVDAMVSNFTVKPLGESNISLRLSVFETLDASFIVKVLLSLAAILITFATVSEERFAGTLKIAIASGASRKHLMLGKLIASFICLAVPLIICTIISCLILAINNMFSEPMDSVRVCLFVLLSLIYILFFLLLGLFISIASKHSSESLITGLLCWLLFVFIVPAVIPQLSDMFVNLPSARTMEQSRAERWSQTMFEWTDSGYHGNWASQMEQIQAKHNADWENHRNLFTSYAKINRWLSLASPSCIYDSAGMELMGNGVQNSIHAKKIILQNKDNLVKNSKDFKFVFTKMAFSSDSMVALLSMIFLCLETTVLLLLAYRQFMRLDLREG